MFNVRRVSQMAAFFLAKEGGRMSHLKLMKLLYLADRESLNRFDAPMSGDRMVSMPHGPVLSQTLDLINGNSRSGLHEWQRWVADKSNNEVALSCGLESVNADTLDTLSRADRAVLEDVWTQFGPLSRFQIRDWTHDNCPEWRDPNGSAFPIQYSEVLTALGRDLRTARDAQEALEEESAAYQVLASV